MGRFWDAVKGGIAQDRANKRPKLNKDEREFQAASIEILETPPSPSARIFSALIMAFLVITLVWAWFGRIDTTATLSGKLVPVGKVKLVEPLVTGKVKALHVKSDQQVQEGEILIELDPTEHAAEVSKVQAELELATVAAARLRATIEGVEKGSKPEQVQLLNINVEQYPSAALQQLQLHQSLASFQAEQDSLAASYREKQVQIERATLTLAERRKLLDISSGRVDIYDKLLEKGLGAKTQSIDAHQSQQDLAMTLMAEQGQIEQMKAAAETISAQRQERREVFLDKTITELVETDRRIKGLTQELAKAEMLEKASVLKAPTSGRVQQLTVNTVGQVVTTGQQLMVIVPDGTALEAEVLLLNKDKGFVHEGQPARIKLETFPFTKYGTLNAEVIAVSSDAIPYNATQGTSDAAKETSGPLVFPVRLSIQAQSILVKGQEVHLTPGMSLQAEVKTGNRRVIEFLFDPLLKMKDEAFHER